MNFGEAFLRFQEAYRRPDGSRWTNTEIERATAGFVRANYLTNLTHGRIRQPGLDRLQAIAQVMGFPVELWFREERGAVTAEAGAPPGSTLAERLNALFGAAKNPQTGRPYTNAEVAELTFGRLTEDRISAAREGSVADLEGAQYVALSNVFGVEISYWYAHPDDLPPLDAAAMAALQTEKGRAVLHKFHDRPEEQKDMILLLLDQLAQRGIDERRY